MERAILHSDLNCFYASVEMMLNPTLKRKSISLSLWQRFLQPVKLPVWLHTGSALTAASSLLMLRLKRKLPWLH